MSDTTEAPEEAKQEDADPAHKLRVRAEASDMMTAFARELRSQLENYSECFTPYEIKRLGRVATKTEAWANVLNGENEDEMH